MNLMASVTANTQASQFWGYVVFYGVGLVIAQITYAIAAQLATPPDLIATATEIFVAARSLSGSIALAIASAIFTSGLSANLTSKVSTAVVSLGLPEPSIRPLIAALQATNATALHEIPGAAALVVSAAEEALQQAYVVAFQHVFIFGAVFATMGILGKSTQSN